MTARVSRTLQLAVAGLLTACAIARLPPLPWHAPKTPYDLSLPVAGRSFGFLSDVARVLPRGVTVVVHSDPPDPDSDETLARMAEAILVDRRVIPASVWRVRTADADDRAEYVVVLGHSPPPSHRRLVFQDAVGAVWRRERAS
jgi:hypothetical protein